MLEAEVHNKRSSTNVPNSQRSASRARTAQPTHQSQPDNSVVNEIEYIVLEPDSRQNGADAVVQNQPMEPPVSNRFVVQHYEAQTRGYTKNVKAMLDNFYKPLLDQLQSPDVHAPNMPLRFFQLPPSATKESE